MFSPTRRTVEAAIAAGATGLSGIVDLADEAPCGIIMPSAWLTAAITFQVSVDEGLTFQNLYDSGGGEVTISSGNVAVSRCIAFTALLSDAFRGTRHVKIRSGTAVTPVNQTATRNLTIQLRQLA